MDVQKSGVAYVIRRDGTIPYDEPNSPEAQAHKTAVLVDLAERGHTATHHPEGHISIHGWDAVKGLNAHPREAEAGEKPLFGG
jgi:hypothetical protein